QLNPAAVAAYPMYRGIASLLGMDLVKIDDDTLESEFDALARQYRTGDYDYFFLHIKPCDSAGEDGDFPKKVQALEKIDRLLPKITGLNPDVLAITGDHSTPANMKGHSWHPVPVLLSGKHCLPDRVASFDEISVAAGGLGQMQSKYLLPLMLANAGKLEKYGA
ncbi:MAG: phosphoglycerate mutase, partial [bacterium]